MKNLCVFCGSSDGAREVYRQQCQALAAAMATRELDLVYGGASIGVMGAIADSVIAHGRQVTGVIPEHLQNHEISHAGLTELFVTKNMHDRKAKMAELSDGFIALPGGIGTLEELFEIATWQQLGLHQKPIGVLNIDHYYDSLLEFLNHSVEEKFLKRHHLDNFLVSSDAETLLDQMVSFSNRA